MSASINATCASANRRRLLNNGRIAAIYTATAGQGSWPSSKVRAARSCRACRHAHHEDAGTRSCRSRAASPARANGQRNAYLAGESRIATASQWAAHRAGGVHRGREPLCSRGGFVVNNVEEAKTRGRWYDERGYRQGALQLAQARVAEPIATYAIRGNEGSAAMCRASRA